MRWLMPAFVAIAVLVVPCLVGILVAAGAASDPHTQTLVAAPVSVVMSFVMSYVVNRAAGNG